MPNAHPLVRLYAQLKRQCLRSFSVGIVVFSAWALSPLSHAMNIDEAVAKVQSEQGGKVLDIQRVTVQNAPAYRIKLLQPEGRVEVLLIDAKSGAPLADGKVKK